MSIEEKKKLIVEIEFKLLSIFMCSTIAKPKIASSLTSNDFISSAHKRIYNSILNLYKKGVEVDSLTLIEDLISHDALDKSGGKQYIQKIYSEYIGDEFFENYIDSIFEYSNKNKLNSLSSFIRLQLNDGKLDSSEIVSDVENKIQDLFNRDNESDFEHIQKISDVVFHSIEKLSKSQESLTGLTTGYPELNALTSGFQIGDLVILAARPSMGKTALAINFVINLAIHERKAKKDTGIAFFSLEMPSSQLVSRMYSMLAQVNLKKILSGKDLSSNDWEKINRAHEFTSKLEIYFDDNSTLTISRLQLKLKKLCKEKPNIKFIVIDYLQLISEAENLSNNSSRQQEIAKISRSLKVIARQLNVTIVCLSQLSRAVEKREDKRPMMSDLRDSGSIEQDADLVMLLYRESYYKAISDVHKNVINNNNINKDNNNSYDFTEVILVKNRNGPTGKILLNFIKEFGIFRKSTN